MSSRSGRRTRRQIEAVQKALGPAELAFLAGLAESATALRAWAESIKDSEVDRSAERARAFEETVTRVAPLFVNTNLVAMIAAGRPGSTAVMALSAERVALGRPLRVLRDGAETGFEWEGAEELAESIEEIEATPFDLRLEMVIEDPLTAEILVGAHIARGGFNDPLAFDPWSAGAMASSLLAHAVGTTSLALLAALADEAFMPPSALDGYIHVTRAAAVLLGGQEEWDEGFGPSSRVIEPLLAGFEPLDLEPADAHRLSGRMTSIFASGWRQEPFDPGDEDALVGQNLLAAAHDLGTRIGQMDLEPEEAESDLPALPSIFQPREPLIH